MKGISKIQSKKKKKKKSGEEVLKVARHKEMGREIKGI